MLLLLDGITPRRRMRKKKQIRRRKKVSFPAWTCKPIHNSYKAHPSARSVTVRHRILWQCRCVLSSSSSIHVAHHNSLRSSAFQFDVTYELNYENHCVSFHIMNLLNIFSSLSSSASLPFQQLLSFAVFFLHSLFIFSVSLINHRICDFQYLLQK